jgi:hypothetical protein
MVIDGGQTKSTANYDGELRCLALSHKLIQKKIANGGVDADLNFFK